MDYRPLGQTGLKVPLVSFGCVELGLPYGIGVSDRGDMLSDDQAIELIHAAIAGGMTFFDTAPSYGKSESILGRAITGRREKVVLCTKCPSLADEAGKALRGKRLRDHLLPSLEASLAALGTNYVDILMLHRVDPAVIANDEVAGLFQNLKEQGMIRAAGVSTYPGGITGQVIDSGRWDVVQLAFNLMDQRETVYLEQARAAGIGIIVRSVLLKGILTDRGRTLHPALESVHAHREACVAAVPEGMILAEFATRYAMSKAGVSSVLIGIDRANYLRQALRMAAAGALPDGDVETGDALAYPDPDFLDLHRWAVRGWLT